MIVLVSMLVDHVLSCLHCDSYLLESACQSSSNTEHMIAITKNVLNWYPCQFHVKYCPSNVYRTYIFWRTIIIVIIFFKMSRFLLMYVFKLNVFINFRRKYESLKRYWILEKFWLKYPVLNLLSQVTAKLANWWIKR